jgi:hypothetical protein
MRSEIGTKNRYYEFLIPLLFIQGVPGGSSTWDIGVLGYMGILYHKEHPPEDWHILLGHPVYA